VVENGAEAHALEAGRIVIDLASQWGLGTQQFV
jgi:hypothetical protein